MKMKGGKKSTAQCCEILKKKAELYTVEDGFYDM